MGRRFVLDGITTVNLIKRSISKVTNVHRPTEHPRLIQWWGLVWKTGPALKQD